jgi:hypothetical protein
MRFVWKDSAIDRSERKKGFERIVQLLVVRSSCMFRHFDWLHSGDVASFEWHFEVPDESIRRVVSWYTTTALYFLLCMAKWSLRVEGLGKLRVTFEILAYGRVSSVWESPWFWTIISVSPHG